MVGRRLEQNILNLSLNSNRSEFLVVYGRRRVGKTYLIKEYFNNSFSFYATGLSNAKTKEQLKAFYGSLIEYGSKEKGIPKDWYEAFLRLKNLLQSDAVRRDPVSGKKVVFWMNFHGWILQNLILRVLWSISGTAGVHPRMIYC